MMTRIRWRPFPAPTGLRIEAKGCREAATLVKGCPAGLPWNHGRHHPTTPAGLRHVPDIRHPMPQPRRGMVLWADREPRVAARTPQPFASIRCPVGAWTAPPITGTRPAAEPRVAARTPQPFASIRCPVGASKAGRAHG